MGGRTTRPASSHATADEDDGNYNPFILGKKTKSYLAEKTGNPELANVSKRGRSIYRSAEEHYNPEAIEELLKENLLREEFKSRKGIVGGYTLDTIPLNIRGEIKEILWEANTNFGEQGKWSPHLTEMKNHFDKNYWGNTMKYIYDRASDDFDSISGLLGHLVVYNPKTETTNADLSNNEFIRLIELHDNDPITPVISGKPGAGKSNFVLHTFRMAGLLNKGYINPAYGKRSRLRAYLPNFNGSNDKSLTNAKYPNIPSSFSYRFPWQIFVDEPKGSSVLWTKYDWSMAQEEENDDSAGIFSMVYLGEVGMGKLRSAMSKDVTLYRNLFQLTRQMRIRYYLSSADPEPLPVSVMEDFINPQIWIDITQSKSRVGSAEYLEKGANGNPTTVKKKLGTIPLDSLAKELGKGIASDMTSEWKMFPLADFLEQSRVTNMDIYLKDPDKVMNLATNFIMRFQDKYMDESYPDMMFEEEENEKENLPVRFDEKLLERKREEEEEDFDDNKSNDNEDINNKNNDDDDGKDDLI